MIHFADALNEEPGAYNVSTDNFRIEEIAEAVEATVGEAVDVTYFARGGFRPPHHAEFGKEREQRFEAAHFLETGIEDLAMQFTKANPQGIITQ